MKKHILRSAILLLLFTSFQKAVAQEVVQGLKQVFDITADKLGNATIEVSMKLNAQQWDQYKRNLGNNTNILKRGMEKALPKYILTDFSYSEDQMERSYKIKFKVLGLCYLNKDGLWESKLEVKNPDITRLSDKEFVLTQDLMMDGILVQQTQKLHLPDGAKDAKVDKDSFGKAVLHYSTSTGSFFSFVSIIGLVITMGGAFLLFKSSRGPSK